MFAAVSVGLSVCIRTFIYVNIMLTLSAGVQRESRSAVSGRTTEAAARRRDRISLGVSAAAFEGESAL